MSPPPLIILDIGSSLVEGPAEGPASRIAARAMLDGSRKRDLHAFLMTNDFEGPGDACQAARERLGLDGRLFESAVAEVWQEQEREATPAPGAREALEFFVAQGYMLALLSNIWTPYARSVHQVFGEFFDRAIPPELQVLSCHEGLAKPALELFRTLTLRAGLSAGDALMIGDSYTNDIEPAAACGMHTLWLLHDPAREADRLVQVLNGAAAAPSAALRSLADAGLSDAVERALRDVIPA